MDMIDEVKKSISATLYERTTSPLFGTFFFSWCVWNWKIVVALFFTTNAELKTTKFEYIDNNLLNIYDGLIFPIISTLLILTLYSWLSEQAYKLWLIFDKRKNDYKNTIENQKLLTIEQSIRLRLEIAKKEEAFENIIKDKEELIRALKVENAELLKNAKNKSESVGKDISNVNSQKLQEAELNQFFENKEAVQYFEKIANYIQHGWEFDSKIADNVASFYIAHDLIVKSGRSGIYDLTEKGKKYLREYFAKKTKPNNV